VEHALPQQIVDVLRDRSEVMAVYLFGSTARGEAAPHSDVDIAVLLAAAPRRALNGAQLVLEGDLERAVRRQVDLIVLNDAPADLRIPILRWSVARRPRSGGTHRVRSTHQKRGLRSRASPEPLPVAAHGNEDMTDPALVDVDLAIVQDILANHLSDLTAFVTAVRRGMPPPS
jgi:predicted nucleotidyltransferase